MAAAIASLSALYLSVCLILVAFLLIVSAVAAAAALAALRH